MFLYSKKKQCALYGKWTECLYAVDIAAFEAHRKNNKNGAVEKKVSKEVRTSDCPPAPVSMTHLSVHVA